jgi:hypothetical protein
MNLPPAARNGLIALVVIVIAALALRIIASRNAGLPEPRLTWDATVAAAEVDPARWMLFIAERQDDGEAAFDWRTLPEPARHLWASLRFELALPAPPSPEGTDTALPTYEEAAAAFDAMGISDAAALVRAMHQSMPTANKRAGPDWGPSNLKLTAMRPRLATARTTYVQAHRADIDRRSGR